MQKDTHFLRYVSQQRLAKNISIGFIGQGLVGKNYADDFEQRGYMVTRYAAEEPYIENKNKIKDCDIVFIAVPTSTIPTGFDDQIIREVIKLVSKGKTAVIQSTILHGSTESIQKENPDIFVLYSPEFLCEDTAAYDVSHPERTIIGVPIDTIEYQNRAEKVLSVLARAPYQKICSAQEAEIIKYG